jgi:hypothetical protein
VLVAVLATATVTGGVVAACGGPDGTDASGDTTASSRPDAIDTPAPTAPSNAAPATTTTVDPLGDTSGLPERPPKASRIPERLASQIRTAELAIRDPATPPERLAELAVVQQVAYRHLGRHPELDAVVLAGIPPELHRDVQRNLTARRELRALHRTLADTMPAWRIVAPPPAGELRRHYDEAQRAFGIPWQYLAAVNLVETGMGRIRGTSVAGAQGPMQFMPATWDAFG